MPGGVFIEDDACLRLDDRRALLRQRPSHLPMARSPVQTLFLGMLLAAVSPVGEDPGLELRYQGTLTESGSGETVKEFEVYVLLTKSDNGHTAAFLIEEDLLPWPERVGRFSIDANGVAAAKPRLEVLYEHDGNDYPLPLLGPLFEHTGRLAPEATWEEGKYRYEVIGRRKVEGRDVWQVEAIANLGRSHALLVEAGTGLVVAADQKVFM